MGLVDRARSRPRAAATVAVAAIVVVSAVVRMLLNRDATGPWIFIDEVIYSELARSAFDGFGIRGVPVSGYGAVYPLLIAPAYAAFDSLVDAYTAAKAINAVVMSLTAVPVYLLARALMRRRWALVASGLSVAIPAMTYTSVIMTESAFYPIFALTMLLVQRALTRPTVVRQVLVFIATVVLFETRPQGAVVLPALIASIVILCAFDARAEGAGAAGRFVRLLGRFWATGALAVAGLVGVVVVQQVRGRSVSDLVGAYAIVLEDESRYQPRALASWFLQHVAETSLWLGVIPFAALLLMIPLALRRTSSREERVFVALAVPIVLGMTVVVTAFAVFANVGRIEERNLFYIGFIPLIALAWWCAAGLPRQPRWLALVLVVAAGLPVAIPYHALINQSAVSDTFGLFLPWAVQNRLMDGSFTPFAVLTGGAIAAALVLVVRPQRAWVLVAAIAVFFAVSGVAVDKRTDKASQGALKQGISVAPDWIDRAVPAGAEVDVLYPGTSEPLKVWQNEFFNRSVDTIYPIAVPLPGALPETVAQITPTGEVTDRAGNPIVSRYVLVDDSVRLDGRRVAADDARHMVLLETEGPLRATESVSGVMGDAWAGAEFAYTRYRCAGGTVTVELESDPSLHTDVVTVVPVVGDREEAPAQVPPTGRVAITTPLVPVDGLCVVRYLVSPTLVPAQVTGAPDTRALGVKVVDVRFAPPSG